MVPLVVTHSLVVLCLWALFSPLSKGNHSSGMETRWIPAILRSTHMGEKTNKKKLARQGLSSPNAFAAFFLPQDCLDHLSSNGGRLLASAPWPKTRRAAAPAPKSRPPARRSASTRLRLVTPQKKKKRAGAVGYGSPATQIG